MKFILPILLALTFASPASAIVVNPFFDDSGVTGSAYWYHNSTSQYAAPNRTQSLAGEFALSYIGKPRLAPIGSINTTLKRVGERYSVAGVFYNVGLRFQVTPDITLEAKHGSWHNLDSSGPTELYNKVGVQIKF